MNHYVLIPVIYIILYINYMSIIKNHEIPLYIHYNDSSQKDKTLTIVSKTNLVECSEKQCQNSPKLFIFIKPRYPSLAGEQKNTIQQ